MAGNQDSKFVPEIADPWVEFELGIRVHDEYLAIAYHTCDDALMRLLITDYFAREAGDRVSF